MLQAALVDRFQLQYHWETKANEMGDARRFIPFVVMHEFEELLFSDCAEFSRGIGNPDMEGELTKIRNQFPTPEDINDSPFTAPSKRIIDLMPRYQKPLLGRSQLWRSG